VHLVLFALRLPQIRHELDGPRQAPKAFVVRPVRFSPPPPRAQQAVPQRREQRRVIPIPDATPDDPEPIREPDAVQADLDALLDDDAIFGVPTGAPGPPGIGDALDALELGGDIVPPHKLFAPQPVYTEEARQARIQGVVILQAVIDAAGNVADVKVLKGLPNGLSESAVEAVRQWRFEPAMRHGQPVAVYFNFTVSFGLQ
jgi:protein TonB